MYFDYMNVKQCIKLFELDLLSAYQKVSFPTYEEIKGKVGRKQMAPETYTLDYEKKALKYGVNQNNLAVMKKRKNTKDDFENCKNAVKELQKRF